MPTKISVAKKSGGFISETNDCTGKKKLELQPSSRQHSDIGQMSY